MQFKDFQAPVLFSSTSKAFQGCVGNPAQWNGQLTVTLDSNSVDRSSLQSEPSHLACSMGRQPPCTVLHPSDKLGEFSQ